MGGWVGTYPGGRYTGREVIQLRTLVSLQTPLAAVRIKGEAGLGKSANEEAIFSSAKWSRSPKDRLDFIFLRGISGASYENS